MDRIILHVYYSGKKGSAAAFAKEMAESGLQQKVWDEPGCLQYHYYTPVGEPDKLLLLEAWQDAASLKLHSESSNMLLIKELKSRYELDTVIERYE